MNRAGIRRYETNMANLVRDVRKDLGAPDLPVVIRPRVASNDTWTAT